LRRHYRVATLRWWVSAAAALVLTSTQARAAQDTIDRPVTIYVAGTAGGGIDLYARLVGRHIGRHIPGKPTVTVQLMPGAGGIRAANYLAEQAPRDGTAMTTFASGPILEPLIGARNPGYDMSSFTWIGAITKDIGLCISWGPTPFKTIDDVKKQQMVVAGTGAGSETDTWPIVLNDVLGTKFKLVTGYVGSQETILAIERGEAHGRCVFSLSALKIAKPDWLRDKKINVLVLTALEKSAEFPGAPAVVDLVAKQEDRQLLELVTALHQARRSADFIGICAKSCSPNPAVESIWRAALPRPRPARCRVRACPTSSPVNAIADRASDGKRGCDPGTSTCRTRQASS